MLSGKGLWLHLAPACAAAGSRADSLEVGRIALSGATPYNPRAFLGLRAEAPLKPTIWRREALYMFAPSSAFEPRPR